MAEDSCLKNRSDVARERIKFSGLVKNNSVFHLYFKKNNNNNFKSLVIY